MHIIHEELSVNATAIYLKQPSEKWLFMINPNVKNKFYSKESLKAFSERIYKDNYPIGKNPVQIDIPPVSVANIISLGFEKMEFGLLILYHDKGSLSAEDLLLCDQIGFYVSAACLANHLLCKNIFKKSNGVKANNYYEVSVKTLLEWRIQEIITDIYKQALPNQRIFQDIIREAEKAIIKSALVHTENNQTLTAKFLGINRNTLRKKIRDLNIDPPVKV